MPAPAAKRPVGLVLAAIVLALFSCMGVLSGVSVLLTAVFIHPPEVEQYRLIEVVQIAFGIFLLLLCGLCGWMVVGLFRVKKWARIGMIVLGAVVAVFSFLSAVLYFVLAFASIPIPEGSPTIAPAMMKLVFFGLAGFSLVFTLIGMWWLVYFNLRHVRALFAGNDSAGNGARTQPGVLLQAPVQAAGVATQAGGTWIAPNAPKRDTIEILVICVAVLYLLGALCGLFDAVARFPLFLMGFTLRGWPAAAVFLVIAAIDVGLGIGLLRRAKAAWIGALIFDAVGLVWMASLFSPGVRAAMVNYQQSLIQSWSGMLPQPPPAQTQLQTQLMGPMLDISAVLGTLVIILIFWLLLRARPLFETKKLVS